MTTVYHAVAYSKNADATRELEVDFLSNKEAEAALDKFISGLKNATNITDWVGNVITLEKEIKPPKG